MARALVGTEGTCVVVAGATVRLWTPPAAKCLLVLGFAGRHRRRGGGPGTPDRAAVHGGEPDRGVAGARWPVGPPGSCCRRRPAPGCWSRRVATTPSEAEDHALRLARTVGRDATGNDVRVLASAAAQASLWRIREDGAGYAARLPDGSPAWPGFEDAAVPPDRLAAYLDRSPPAAPGPGDGWRHLWPLR